MAKGSKSPQVKGKTTGTRGRRSAPPVAVRRQTPWGLIAGTLAVVVFAAVAIGYAVVKVQQSKPIDPAKGLADAKRIPGIITETIKGGQHTTDPVRYDHSPPIGGQHDPTWADCSGTVYTGAIRNENAVHTLEHGAVWITYRPDLPAGDVDKLKGVVDGKNYTLLSPYPGLESAVSLQAWGFQVQLGTLDMGLVKRFLRDLRDNPLNAPEPHGNCSNPDFKAAPLPPGPTPTAAPTTTPTAAPGTTTPPSPSGSSRPTGSAPAPPTPSPTKP